MEIRFQTKEESNRLQREDFLKLPGGERVLAFLRLCAALEHFPSKKKLKQKDNFIIKIIPK
ncbi:hypothetical protein CHU92_02420 [Flavobacterium cyanobacteriorum]|uniref:Uncharacterized protein n=1 Tax=Flavobacterium cyanobacteriorum TaxID=2022802 RepID=A0A255ZUG8_9FLAO|nr:hypothetical protein [Flavobacterium cyanobacteriorum]OYQ44410.1 hypothetical protein CHU92_02420 [Flavobacterium cyanobacteriorum]